MDSLLASRFKRVEMALASLIDSIAKYNPNPIHAKDLVAADAELTQGLEQCQFKYPTPKNERDFHYRPARLTCL